MITLVQMLGGLHICVRDSVVLAWIIHQVQEMARVVYSRVCKFPSAGTTPGRRRRAPPWLLSDGGCLRAPPSGRSRRGDRLSWHWRLPKGVFRHAPLAEGLRRDGLPEPPSEAAPRRRRVPRPQLGLTPASKFPDMSLHYPPVSISRSSAVFFRRSWPGADPRPPVLIPSAILRPTFRSLRRSLDRCLDFLIVRCVDYSVALRRMWNASVWPL